MLKFSIQSEMARRILILDGGLGTMVHGYGLTEDDFRGEMFRDWPMPLLGCNEALVMSRPDVLSEIHEAYLQAGADIISTDSFNANALSLSDQMLDFYVYDICKTAASIARAVADKYTLLNPSKPRFVAGSIGPGNRSASISPDVNDPAARAVTFDQLSQAYYDQARGLVDGGADLILLETFFDTLNVKAAIFAVEKLAKERKKPIPIMVSGTLTDTGGRTLAGQTVEAFYASVHHGNVISVGLNCGHGAERMRPYIERLSAVASCAVSAHPNAGLPDNEGRYSETPEMMAATIEDYLSAGLLNIVGGCCGTTPMHIAAIAAVASKYAPRQISQPKDPLLLSGLELATFPTAQSPIVLGVRSDATQSMPFAAAICEKHYAEAVNIIRTDIESGSPVAVINVDDPMAVGTETVRNLLNLAMATPEIARVPVVVFSSEWKTLETAMQCVQGKPLIGPLTLAEGEEEFLRRLSLADRYGAAAWIALIDEQGIADTLDRKRSVAQRITALLEQAGFPQDSVVIDPVLLPVIGYADTAKQFMAIVEELRTVHPQWRFGGRINVFSSEFQGCDAVVKTLNSVMLERAAAIGLDFAVADPQTVQPTQDQPAQLRVLCDKLITDGSTETIDAFTEYVVSQCSEPVQQLVQQLGDVTDGERLSLQKLLTEQMDTLLNLEKCVEEGVAPLALLQRVIHRSCNQQNDMAQAAEPAADSTADKSRRLLWVSIDNTEYDPSETLLKCLLSKTGYQVKELLYANDAKQLTEVCRQSDCAAVVLHGATSRALGLIESILTTAQKEGLMLPFLVEGAATSVLHTAVKLAPKYANGTVVYLPAPVSAFQIIQRVCSNERDVYLIDVQMEQISLREEFANRAKNRPFRTLADARTHGLKADFSQVKAPLKTGQECFVDYDLKRLLPLINWNYLFGLAGMPGRFPDLLDDPTKGEQARRLYDDAQQLLQEIIEQGWLHARGVVALYPARRDGDDIVLYKDDACTNELLRMPQLRNQQSSQAVNLSLADFVASAGDVPDSVALYAVTVGDGLDALQQRLREAGDEARAKLAGLLTGRLCEAMVEEMHRYVRVQMWGIEQEDQLTSVELLEGKYSGIRPNFGMPSCPDRSYRKTVAELLNLPETIGLQVNDQYELLPAPALCGLIFALPEARNFNVGQVDAEQLAAYASRRGIREEQLRKLIPQYIQA